MTLKRAFVFATAIAALANPVEAGSAVASGGISFVQPLATSLQFELQASNNLGPNGPQSAYGLAKGDFDEDGILDLAVTASQIDERPAPEESYVYFLRGLGDGRFATPARFAVPRQGNGQPAYAYGIVAGDFTSDGMLDVMVAVPDLRQLVLFEGNGDGTFEEPLAIDATDRVFLLQAGHLDGDEHLDVVTAANFTGDRLIVLRGDGDGTFQPPTFHPVSTGITDIVLADFNGDLSVDMAVGSWHVARVFIFLNDGDGEFSAAPLQADTRGRIVNGVWAAQFDGDQILDLVIAGPGGCPSGAWMFLRGNGDGTFAVSTNDDCSGPTGIPIRPEMILRQHETIDVDGDGNFDVVSIGPGNFVEVGHGDGDGRFRVSRWVASPGPGYERLNHSAVDSTNHWSPVTGDFDEDGTIDIAVASSACSNCRAGGVSLLLGDTPGTFRAPRNVTLPGTYLQPRGTALADFTGDGALDLVSMTQSGGLRVIPGMEDGTLWASPTAASGGPCLRNLSTADFDADGNLDVVCPYSDQGAWVSWGDGAGQFPERTNLPNAFWAGHNPIAGDFNGDDHPDVLHLHAGGTIPFFAGVALDLYDPASPRTFIRSTIVAPALIEGAFNYAIGAADFNRDGHLDFVYRNGLSADGSRGEERFMLFRGNGDGTFQSPLTTAPGLPQVTQFLPFDLDHDGFVDLLCVTSDGFRVMLGNGDATFDAPVAYRTTASNAFEAEIADLDADGVEDVAVASGYFGFSTALAIFKGHGDGTFDDVMLVATGRDATHTVDLGDLNGDARPEVVAGVQDGVANFTVLINGGFLPDLVVSEVMAPDGGAPGDPVAITYTVRNESEDFADGDWVDAVYLSGDETLDSDDLLIGTLQHRDGLGSEETYSATLTAPLPGDVAGPHFILVRADVDADVGELDEDNVGSRAFAVEEVPLLQDGVPLDDVIATGESRYFRYIAQPGSELLFRAALQTPNAVELYVRFDRPPTTTAFDQRYATPGDLTQDLVFSPTRAGTYYVLLVGAAGGGERPFTITARELGLEILSLSHSTGSNLGSVSVTITGAGFTPNTIFTLRANGIEREAESVVFNGSSGVGVTFDLAGLPVGSFDVIASDGEREFTLTDGFDVIQGTLGRVVAKLVMPVRMTPAWTMQATVNLENVGDTDVAGTSFVLRITSNNAAFINPDGSESSEVLFPAGVTGGVLPARAKATFTCPFHCNLPTDPRDVDMELVEIREPVGLDAARLKQDLRPAYVPADAWDAIWDNFTARVGTDLGDLFDVLDEDARYLASVGQPTENLNSLLHYELGRAGFANIAARYLMGAFGRGRLAPWETVVTTDDDGNVQIRNGVQVRKFFRRTNGTFRGTPGDYATLTAQGGGYRLREPYGAIGVYRASGTLDYTEDTNGNRITYLYSGNRVTGRSYSNGDSDTIAYNGNGRVASIVDVLGRETTFTYDASGEHLMRMTDFDGSTSYTYVTGEGPSVEHAVRTVTDQEGVTQTFSYDALGRRISGAKNGGAEAFSIDYPSLGCKTVTSAVGEATTSCLDGAGRIRRSTDPLGRTTRYTYDLKNELVEIFWPDGTRTSRMFDARGAIMRETDPLGHSIELTHDVTFNRLTSLEDARNNRMLFRYDDRGNLVGIDYPNGKSESFDHDERGNRTESIDRRGKVVTLTYNDVDDVTHKKVGDAAPIEYTYDSLRRVTDVTDDSGTTQYDYDDRDRLARITYPDGRFVAFEFDDANRRSRMVTHDGFAVRYEYDAVGRLAAVTDDAGVDLVTYAYDVAGRLAQRTNRNGTSVSYTYDGAGRIERIEHHLGPIVQAFFAYEYDAMDRPTIVRTADGATELDYDDRGQLTEVRLPSGRVIKYEYDAAGNRTRVIDGGSTTTYQSNSLNQYTAVGGTSLSYDDAGNLITKGGRSYTYDDEGRLLSVVGGGINAQYEYDHAGMLVAGVENGARTEYLRDPAGLSDVVATYDDSGDARAHYLYGHGLAARADADGFGYFGFDAIANTALLTDDSGTPLNSHRHLPYGETLSSSENVADPFGFGGEIGVIESSTGNHYMRARWYDSQLGRFVSPDPIGVDGDTNLYRYGLNAPTANVDPSGLEVMNPAAFEALVAGIIRGIETAQITPAAAASVLGAVRTAAGNAAWYPVQTARLALGPGGQNSPLIAAVSQNARARVGQALFRLESTVNKFSGFSAARMSLRYAVKSAFRAGLLPWAVIETANLVVNREARENFQQFYEDYAFVPFWNWMFSSPPSDILGERTLALLEYCAQNPGDPICAGIQQHAEGSTTKRASFDPNDIIGPAGFGPEGWIAGGQPLPYMIRFENLAAATAAAATVTVTHQLDPDLDPETFELGTIGWADVTVDVPVGSKSFATRVDDRAVSGLYVDVEASLDSESGVVVWRLQAIDPATGEAPGPESPAEGFLFPNDASHRGEGYVSLRVTPLAESSTGTRIDAQARIVFDLNAPIDTPAIFNTLDVDGPDGGVEMLAAVTPSSDIQLFWSGTDVGSGIAHYDIYASIDGAEFAIFLDDTTLTSASYEAEDGRTYAFFAVAVDNAGNVELTPATPDTTTQVSVAVTPAPTPTPEPSGCVGDCNDDGSVGINELIRGVSIALGRQAVGECPSFDRNGDGQVSVGELVTAVGRALNGCTAEG